LIKRVLFAAMLVLVGCTKAEPELRERDRPELQRIVAEDVRASQAMHAADEALAKGDAKAALVALETQASPAIDEGLRLAETARLETAWGRAKRDAVLAVLRERKTELPRYSGAVRSGDPEQLIVAIEAQAVIERRALAAVAGIHEGR
jgi:hypothetical protein